MKIEKSIVLSDIHFDDADERAVALATKFAKEFKPDNIFLNGDIIDNWAVSRHPKHPFKQRGFDKDVLRSKDFLQQLRREHPRSRIVYVHGNHEYRLEAYITNNSPELYGFTTLNEILDLKKLGIEAISSIHKENWFKYKDLYVGHYDKVTGNAASTAQSLIRERGVSVIQGHVHRVGMTAKTFLDRTLFGYENPCLCSLDSDYVKKPNWQQGFTLIFADQTTTWVSPIVFKDYKFIWNEKLWIG